MPNNHSTLEKEKALKIAMKFMSMMSICKLLTTVFFFIYIMATFHNIILPLHVELDVNNLICL